MVKPDSGNIKIFENIASMSSPKDAINLGIGMVHQHFMLVENFSVLESIKSMPPEQMDLIQGLVMGTMGGGGAGVPFKELLKIAGVPEKELLSL